MFDRKKWQNEWQNKRRHEAKIKIDNIKKEQGKCQYCGYNKYWQILEFHHRDPKLKKFGFSEGGLGNRKWNIVLEEIKKCDLICPNCHRMVTLIQKRDKIIH